MKKIFLLPAMVLAFMSFTACQEDSLDPLPTKVIGQYMTLNITQPTLEFDNIETTAFRGTLDAPGKNVAKYELFIRRRTPNGVITSDPVLLQTITTFPYELNITPAQIADALGVDRSVLQVGDVYRFIGYSYDASGRKAGYNNIAAIVRSTQSMKQGYKWSADVKTVINPDDPFNSYTPFSNF